MRGPTLKHALVAKFVDCIQPCAKIIYTTSFHMTTAYVCNYDFTFIYVYTDAYP